MKSYQHILGGVIAICVLCLTNNAGATILSAGDEALVGFGPSGTDSFSFVTLVNLDSGTTITLTDNGWLAAGGFRTGEGTITYTAPANVRAGTILNWADGGGSNSAGFSYASEAAGGGSAISLNAGGESFIIVNGAASAVTSSTPLSSILWGLQSKAAWNADATSTSASARPGISSTFTPAFSNSDVAYNGTTAATDKATWQTRIGTNTNFSGSNSGTTVPTGSYNVISNLTWNASTNSTWDTTTSNKNFSDGTNTTWFNSSDNVTFGNTGVGTVSIAAGGITGGTVTINHSFGSYTFSGGSVTATSLAKSGNGTATIGNAASFSGGTTVSAGTLLVSGSLSGSVSVTGGTFGGAGTVGSGVAVSGTGTISPGSSPGKLTLQSGLDLSGGGTYLWQLATLHDNTGATHGPDFDQLALTGGNLKLGGTSKLTLDFSILGAGSDPNFTAAFWQSNHAWTIIAGTGATNTGSTNFSQLTNGSYADGNFGIGTDASGNATLQFTAIPEPQSWLVALCGLGTLVALQRFRRVLRAIPR